MSKDVVEITVGEDLIKPILETKIQTAIHEALGRNPEELVEAIVKTALNCKTDENGKVNSSSYENRYNFLEAIVKKAIREEAKKALDEILNEHRDKIRDAVKKQLMAGKGASKIAVAVIDGIANDLKCEYRSNLTIKFETPQNY